MAGTLWSSCGGGVTGMGCGGGVGVVGLGILWMERYSLLSGTSSSLHTASSRSAVGRDSSLTSESVSDISEGISSKVRCHQIPSKNGSLRRCLGVKGEMGAGLW